MCEDAFGVDCSRAGLVPALLSFQFRESLVVSCLCVFFIPPLQDGARVFGVMLICILPQAAVEASVPFQQSCRRLADVVDQLSMNFIHLITDSGKRNLAFAFYCLRIEG